MFGPLAWTKTFILIASLIIVVTMIPGFAHWLYSQKVNTDRWRLFWNGVLIACGLIVAFTLYGWGGLILITLGINNLAAMYREKYQPDRKSTRLNSSHVAISYAVFCLKKKNMSD